MVAPKTDLECVQCCFKFTAPFSYKRPLCFKCRCKGAALEFLGGGEAIRDGESVTTSDADQELLRGKCCDLKAALIDVRKQLQEKLLRTRLCRPRTRR